MRTEHALKLVIIAVFQLFPTNLKAQELQQTQIGRWVCNRVIGLPIRYDCPNVKFAKSFGSNPDVAISLSDFFVFPVNRVTVNPTAISNDGFKVQLDVAFRPEPSTNIIDKVSGFWFATGEAQPIVAKLSPAYVVLSVIYAPPGTDNGRSSSSVTYGASSSVGTTTSTTKSFREGYGISFDAEGGFLGSGGGGGLAFNYSRDTSDRSSTDIKKTANTTLEYGAPLADGIDHDFDAIYLWLNPKVSLKLGQNSGTWSFDGQGTAEIQYVYVTWLKNPQSMPKNVSDLLASHGIHPDEYGSILRHDPFSDSSYVADPSRFKRLNTTFAYEPSLTPNGPSPTQKYELVNTVSGTEQKTTEDSYKVSINHWDQGNYLDFAKARLKENGEWEWRNSQSSGTGTSHIESATVRIGSPSSGYAGPTQVEVLYDTVYRTFAFAFYESSRFLDETVSVVVYLKNKDGSPAGNRLVDLDISGEIQHTYANSDGMFRALVDRSKLSSLRVAGIEVHINAEVRGRSR